MNKNTNKNPRGIKDRVVTNETIEDLETWACRLAAKWDEKSIMLEAKSKPFETLDKLDQLILRIHGHLWEKNLEDCPPTWAITALGELDERRREIIDLIARSED